MTYSHCHHCKRKLGFNECYYIVKAGKVRAGACCEDCYDNGKELKV